MRALGRARSRVGAEVMILMKGPGVNLDAGAPSGPGTLTPSLLVGLRENDTGAWRRMTDLYGPMVYRWCREAGLQAEDADDVRQEVFRAAARGLADFRRDRPGDSFGAWLRVVVRRKLLDYWRARKRQPGGVGGTGAQEILNGYPEVAETSSDGKVAPNEAAELLHRALGQIRADFTEKTWQAFWLVTVEGRTPAEAGQELAMTRGAVHIAKCRVLKRFRDEFQDLLDLGDDS
jgi:RNA polymerase sigma-70 factor (ECF subfamily)